MRPSCTEVLFAGVLIVLAAWGAALLEKHLWQPHGALATDDGTLRWMLTMLAILGVFNDGVFLYRKSREWRERKR